MFDIRWIRDNPQAFDEGRARRGLGPLAHELVALDDGRRAAVSALQHAQERRNAASKEIGVAMREKNQALADALKAEVAALKESWPALEDQERRAGKAIDNALAKEPNLPLAETPDGLNEQDNVEVRRVGAPPAFAEGFKPLEHFEIGEMLGMMDFEAAARMSGARFVVLKGQLARLERALMQFMLDMHTDEHGYTEIDPPVLVRDDTMFGTAQLPKFVDDQFTAARQKSREELLTEALQYATDEETHRLAAKEITLPDVVAAALGRAPTREDFWLVPTAEVPLTNLVRGEILDEKQLPIRMTAGTLCFRAEAGAAGRDTRGMIRQHQFKKVELVSITTPDEALAEHERMTACAENVLKRLGLHYRVVTLCAGDMGFSAQKTYDIEVWLPGQGRFREISSCSVCGDFQARRMNARYRPADGKGPRFVATLNGSGVAVGRALVAVLENYQNPDGSVTVPEPLRRYMGGRDRIARA